MPAVALPTGVSLHYEEVGAGEPVVLVAGTGSDHALWAGTAAAYAAAGYRVVSYDHRGTGRSDHPPDPASYSMRVLAEDLSALLTTLGIARAHVSGLSLGSAVAQELALAHPEQVASLQLHCTWGRTDAWLARLFDCMAYPVRHGDLAMFVRQAFLWVTSPTFLGDHAEEAAAAERAYALENPHPPSLHGLLGHLHADIAHDALDRLGAIACPTLVTSGELDWQVPTRYGREVQARIPGSRLHVFAGPRSSHAAFLEMPGEWNETTLAFLGEHSLAGAAA